VRDGVHRDPVHDRETVEHVGEVAHRRAEREAVALHDLERRRSVAEALRRPVLDAADVDELVRRWMDHALPLVARVGPEGHIPSAGGVDDDEGVVLLQRRVGERSDDGEAGGRGRGSRAQHLQEAPAVHLLLLAAQ
jgi:hypothetical protein